MDSIEEARQRVKDAVDLLATIVARSDQQNYDDYIGGPKVVTIAEVRSGSVDQPIEIHLAEFPDRPYKPSKSMRRVMIFAWGSSAAVYVGRRLKLYGDPDVRFGGKSVGGIKIGGMSNIDKPFTIALTETRGSKKPHRVEPLPDAPPSDAITKPQLQQLAALITKAGFENDDNGRADWLAYASNVVARPVNGTKELTTSEAALVIADMEKAK